MEHDCSIYTWNSIHAVEGIDGAMVRNTLLIEPRVNCSGRLLFAGLLEDEMNCAGLFAICGYGGGRYGV